MNANQARAVGEVTTKLLLHAEREGLTLTAEAIVVDEGNYREQLVTLHACYLNGYDYHARVAVEETGAIVPSALVRVWDSGRECMTDWETRDTAWLLR